MDNTTIVLPSARAIRHEQLSLGETLFLPNFITMSDFISKLCVVPDIHYLDEDSRILLLLEASDFTAFEKLKIERNFFTFTKNSTYIFKFFEELSAELYPIEKLKNADLYGEYEEHIAILEELYLRYEALCREKKLLDRIFLPKLYRFNESYAKRLGLVVLHLEGHLTNFELELFEHLTAFCEVHISFSATAFNTKMAQRLLDIGIVTEPAKHYLFSLNTKQILECRTLPLHAKSYCQGFSESLLQVAYIKEKIAAFIEAGCAAERIAVILPDESFAPLLHSFDTKGNLNFAMGISFTQSQIYKELDAAIKFIEENSKESEARHWRIGERIHSLIAPHYFKNASEIDVVALLEQIGGFIESKSQAKLYAEELFRFVRVIPFMREMRLKSLLGLFMVRLRSLSMDDVRGGKVTVMGVLETRGVAFDGVIIVDFDENSVPKRSQKDMFLNSSLREKASLPIAKDRENLQKHYYDMLLRRSKYVAISYVNAAQNAPSRFLKQLHIQENPSYSEAEYASILFAPPLKKPKEEQEVAFAYSFKDVLLSATSLKTFLECKRKYYYKYIVKMTPHTIPKDMPQEHEIGTAVHAALKELYTRQSHYEESVKLKADLHTILDSMVVQSELERYLIALQKKRLEAFCEAEVRRFDEGWSVYGCELKLTSEFAGIKIQGSIDRIDIKDGRLCVLDYKTGAYTLYTKNKLPEACDFQLEFYYLLASTLGQVDACAFYDLKESMVVPESFLEEKLQLLRSHLEAIAAVEFVEFSKCETLAHCAHCDYAIVCGRE